MTFRSTESAGQLRRRLKNVGLSDPAIQAAWPTWWSDAADASSSARAELRFSLARKLGLDPHSLLEDEEPRFVWRGAARFKHLSGEGEVEQSVLTSFGAALARIALLASTESWMPLSEQSAGEMRSAILRTQPTVRLLDLLSASWSVGIPVIHLRIFPWTRKRMSAMAVRVDKRYAILLAKDSDYPAHISFYLAHELGHIALGHLGQESALVDLDLPVLTASPSDSEEVEADRFALALLTGTASPTVLSLQHAGARSLAQAALDASNDLGIEPGTLALCFGYSTGEWAIANAAMQHIYASPKPVWREVNRIALTQLSLDRIPDDTQAYLQAVLGDPGA